MSAKQPIHEIINEAFKRMRIINRDAFQSWDGCNVEHADACIMAAATDGIHATAKKLGFELPPVEMGGGAMFLQSAKERGEDPVLNLEDYAKLMPNARVQILIRGRQGVGYKPVNEDDLEKGLELLSRKGVKVFRVFDVMDDEKNLAPTYRILTKLQAQYPERGIVIEGATPYMSPSKNGVSARTHDELGESAVMHARLGANATAIKNYAGVGDKHMVDLARTRRKHLVAGGFPTMSESLHDHGQKPEVLADSLAAGVHVVDVSIGDFAGGPSHTNARDFVMELLKREGHDVTNKHTLRRINDHPLMKSLKVAEEAAHEIVFRERTSVDKTSGKEITWTLDSRRTPLKGITQEQVDANHIALGAYFDVQGRINKSYVDGKKPASYFPESDEYFRSALKVADKVREMAGHYDSVTPGAKIATEQGIAIVEHGIYHDHAIAKYRTENKKEYARRVKEASKKFAGTGLTSSEMRLAGQKAVDAEIAKPFGLGDWNTDIVDIAAGRYGKNVGMEKGLGDTEWLNASLMHRALKRMEKEWDSSSQNMAMFLQTLNSKLPKGTYVPLRTRGTSTTVTRNSELETILKKIDIDTFRSAVSEHRMAEPLKAQLLFDLSNERFPEPASAREDSRRLISRLHGNDGQDIAAIAAQGGRISTGEDAVTLASMVGEEAFKRIVTTAQDAPKFDPVENAKKVVAQLGGNTQQRAI